MGEACNHQCDSCGSNGNCSTQDLEHEKRVKEHTSGVKNVIAVVGGKGGVGKSLVTSLLAIQTQRLGYFGCGYYGPIHSENLRHQQAGRSSR